MARTHVWLLDRGGPDSPEAVRPWLEQVARDPASSPLPGVLVFLLAWVWSHWAARRVVPVCRRLGQTSPQLTDAQEQARLLQKLLGKRYEVHAVFRAGGGGPTAARAALGKSDQVVLLPLHPQRHPVAHRAALDDAWKVLHGVGAASVDAWGLDSALHALVARRIRAQLIALKDHGPVGVVLASPAPPQSGTAAADAYLAELAETGARLRATTRLSGPVVQGWLSHLAAGTAPSPSVSEALRTVAEKGAKSAIVVPHGCTTRWPELALLLDADLDGLAAQVGLQSIRTVAPLAPSADFARLLVPLVRRAERDAGWEVPEDDVRKAIVDELKNAGHPTIPARST